MSLLIRKLAYCSAKNVTNRYNESQVLLISYRNLSIVPSVYDGEKDPAPKFFSTNVQTLLKRLTRPDFARVFRKRTNSGLTTLKTPQYKFLTDEELEVEIAKAHKRADVLLQMPPVVKVHKSINEVLSIDPAITGHDESTFVFTDITFGVHNAQRIIVQRDTDGTLRSSDHDIRKRLNQVYFPMTGRKTRDPVMFTDEERLASLLDKQHYEFVLDRACIQFEPDELLYQKITSTTYQHIDLRNAYDLLRSTRHFGPLVFYLSWHRSTEALLLSLLQSAAVRDAVLLVALRQDLHHDVTDGDVARELVTEILPTPIQLTKPETLTEQDIQLDTKCVEVIERYIASNSSMKAQQELALQGFREWYNQLIELSRGVRKAHGNA